MRFRNPWTFADPILICPSCRGEAVRVGLFYWIVKWLVKWVAPPVTIIVFFGQVFAGQSKENVFAQIFHLSLAIFIVLLVVFWFLTQDVPSYTYRCRTCRHVFRVNIRSPLWKQPFYALAFGGFLLFLIAISALYVMCLGRGPACF